MALLAGAAMALGGAAIYVGKGVQRETTLKSQELSGGGGNRVSFLAQNTDPQLIITNPTHISYTDNQDISAIQSGIYGIPKGTVSNTIGSGGTENIKVHGKPHQNGLWAP